MKAYYEIIQRTEAWYAVKYGRIGGTLCDGLLVKSDTLLKKILSCKLEPFALEPEGYISADMWRGIDLEPNARQAVSEYIGKPLKECGWLQSTEHDLLGISPDGITECETEQAEIKCPAREKHTEILLSDVILSDYIDQCIHAFVVNDKLLKLHFASYRPESEIQLKVITLTPTTPVTMGTKAKPVTMLVREWVEVFKGAAMQFDALVKTKVEFLKQP